MKKLVIFDFDGTLLNTLPELKNTMNKAFTINNLPTLSLETYKNSVNGNVDEVISKLLGDNFSQEKLKNVKDTYLKVYLEPHEDVSKSFEGMYEVLLKLQEKNILLAINSNRYTESIKSYVKQYFNEVNFIEIRGHDPPKSSKPNSYGVDCILENTGVKKEDVIYIGDSITDIRTAQNSGIECALVNWGYATESEYDNSYVKCIITKPADILKLF